MRRCFGRGEQAQLDEKVFCGWDKFGAPYQGRPQGRRGETSPTGKFVVEKWSYFGELYKMTEVQEEGIENG